MCVCVCSLEDFILCVLDLDPSYSGRAPIVREVTNNGMFITTIIYFAHDYVLFLVQILHILEVFLSMVCSQPSSI